MNESKLKACPFCGSTKVSVGVSWDGKGQHRHQVECEECEAFGPSTEHQEHVAEARWNDRAGDREQEAKQNGKALASSAGARGYTYAIVLLETLSVKQFTNRDDLNAAIEAKGKDNCVILKWHAGVERWVMPEVYA